MARKHFRVAEGVLVRCDHVGNNIRCWKIGEVRGCHWAPSGFSHITLSQVNNTGFSPTIHTSPSSYNTLCWFLQLGAFWAGVVLLAYRDLCNGCNFVTADFAHFNIGLKLYNPRPFNTHEWPNKGSKPAGCFCWPSIAKLKQLGTPPGGKWWKSLNIW